MIKLIKFECTMKCNKQWFNNNCTIKLIIFTSNLYFIFFLNSESSAQCFQSIVTIDNVIMPSKFSVMTELTWWEQIKVYFSQCFVPNGKHVVLIIISSTSTFNKPQLWVGILVVLLPGTLAFITLRGSCK